MQLIVKAEIFYPAFAMAALTFIVFGVMFARRVAQMKRERIHPQAVATSSRSTALLTDSGPADNLRNLFELPVLFYLALIVAALTDQVTTTTLALAWMFVASRVLHSVIQCGYNTVMHRFRAFAFGLFVLLALWVLLGYGLLSG